MRKFRAWDKIDKEYCEIASIHYEFASYDLVLLKPTDIAPKHWCLRKFDDVVLEQFTGLHDKNGKEIYEGDIVVLRNEVPRGNGQFDDAIFEVIYDIGCCAYLGKDYENNCKEYLGHLEPDEVIGNIHENPELL